MKRNDPVKNPTLYVECDCGTVDHFLKFEYWGDDDWNELYVTSAMRIQSVWRRLRAAIQVIVWGEVDSGVDLLWSPGQVSELNGFISKISATMLQKQREMEDKYEQSRSEKVLRRG